jgi:cell division GTPase FtsZ
MSSGKSHGDEMIEENVNRVVVVDDQGDARKKTMEEIAVENASLEEALQGKPVHEKAVQEEEAEKLDPTVLAKLKAKKEQFDKEESMPIKAVARRDRSLRFGVVGLGQAGSRIAETFYGLGYEACAMNTATQDLEYIRLPENRRILLPFALGGAGKELDNGRQAVEQNAELVLEQIGKLFGDGNEMILLAVSGGGGTGSGGAEAMLSLLATLGKPVGVIYVLPMESEDSLSKHNSVVTLGKLAKMASTDVITTLIVVDNAKIELIYPGLSKAEFWTTANTAIVGPLHLFNHLSAMPTPYDSLDSMDFGRIFTAGDCTIYGMIEVEDYMETTSIAEAVLENLQQGLLASDFDLKEARFGGFILVGSLEVLRKLPAENIHYAQHMISEACDYAQLTKGVYEMEDMAGSDCVRLYTMFSGLGLPAGRIEALKRQAEEQMSQVRAKEESRAQRMAVNYEQQTDTTAQANEIHRLIKQKKSAFGRITQQTNKRNSGGVIDRRKR